MVRRNPYYHATRGDLARQILQERKLKARPAHKYAGRPAVFAGDVRSSAMADDAMNWADIKHSLHFGAHPDEENVLIEFDARDPDDRRGAGGDEAVWFDDVEIADPKIVRRRPGQMKWNGRHEARRSSNKEVSDLIQKARAQGWAVLHSGSGHYIFRSPDKSVPQVVVPSTPGGGNRSMENVRAKLKKSGLVMNGTGANVAERFRKLVNMTPAQIRAWSRDPRSRCYSFAATRARLPALAKLRAKPVSEWTAKDYAFAKRVVSFNARMIGAKNRDGCRDGYTISLRNWGHDPKCKVPVSCKRRRTTMKSNRRRMRRNPQVSYGLIAAGVAAVAALAWLASRPSASPPPPGSLAANPNAAAAVAAQREPEIARMMARGMTRAEAAARYDRAVGAVFAAASSIASGLRPTSGMGSYYRS